MKPNISVVVPVYNEEENLENAVVKLNSLLEKSTNRYEIIIVNGNSTDNTKQIANNLSNNYDKVTVIHQSEKIGFGKDLRDAYEKCNLDYVWYVDADIPYDLNNLNNAIPFLEEYDAVIGYKSGKRENFLRNVMSFTYNNLIKLVFNIPYRDINYSFKIVKNDVIKKLDLKSDGWFITAEMLIALNKGKYKVKEIHIPFIARTTGNSTISVSPKLIFYFLKNIYEHKRKQIKSSG